MSAGKPVQDLEERLEHMHRELAKARQRITELEEQLEDGAGGDVPDDLGERLVALESTVDTDLDGKAYEELTRKDKVREIQTALIDEAASSTTNKTAIDYQEIRWLFNARPSAGHVYDLMDFAGQEDGFDYQRRDGDNNRLTVDLDDVNEELRVHAANNRDG
jgi:cell division septum initiation protein DivIVA